MRGHGEITAGHGTDMFAKERVDVDIINWLIDTT